MKGYYFLIEGSKKFVVGWGNIFDRIAEIGSQGWWKEEGGKKRSF